MKEEGADFNSLLRAGRALRDRAKLLAAGDKRAYQNDVTAWGVDRKDMGQYLGRGFSGIERVFPSLREEIQKAVAAAKEKGHKVVMIDLAGQASGTSLGADTTLCLSLARREENSAHKVIEGNIFNKEVQSAFLAALDAEGGDLAFVVFNPVGGLMLAREDQSHGIYKAGRLEGFFWNIYERLASPGVAIVQLEGGATNNKEFLSLLEHKGIEYVYDAAGHRIIVRK